MNTIIRTNRRRFENVVLPKGQRAFDDSQLEEYLGDGVTPGGNLVQGDTFFGTTTEINLRNGTDLPVFPRGKFVYNTETNKLSLGDGSSTGGKTLEGGAGGLVEAVAATTTNLDLSSTASATLDGVTLVSGDLVLVKDQSTASQNGIYKYTPSQVLARPVDYSTSDNFADSGLVFYVSGGTTNGNLLFSTTNPSGFTLDSDSITFLKTSASFAGITDYAPADHTKYEVASASDVNTVKKALDKEAQVVSEKLREHTDTNLYTELRSRLARNSDTGELFLILGDGTTSTKYRLDVQLDARTERIPGATPNQSIHPHVSSPDKHLLELITINGVVRAFVIPSDGSTKKEVSLGISAALDSAEKFDFEYTDVDNAIGLGATESFSLITGNSDVKGVNGLSIVQNLQPADAGSNPYPLVISGGYGASTDKPLGKLLDKSYFVVVPFKGAIDTFLLTAQAGEECLNSTASAITGVTAPANKRYTCIKTASREIDGTSLSVPITSSAANSGDIQFTCTATDLTVLVNTGDIIHTTGCDGDATHNGQHKVTAVTATTITVDTTFVGADSTGDLRLSALVELVTSTGI